MNRPHDPTSRACESSVLHSGSRMLSVVVWLVVAFLHGCAEDSTGTPEAPTVPHEERWGIYSLNLTDGGVELVYSSPDPIAGVRLNTTGNRFVFSQRLGGDELENGEICTVGADGTDFRRLTDNTVTDVYPCWSPDGGEIAFLSWRDDDMDIYIMGAEGQGVRKLYDSGFHDADIDWVGDQIVFTQNSQIWVMTDEGDSARQVTDPPNAGEWGSCNLPFGDYDPRLSPGGSTIAFERLEDDDSVHGNYDIFLIATGGTYETRLTETGWSQGFATWSHDGSRLAYVVAAVGEEGRYDLYVMNADGTENRNITPSYFPPEFLCHSAVFSVDDSALLFVGEWWE